MKRLKYGLKTALLSRRPGWYWGARRLLRGPLEPELELIAALRPGSGAFVDVGANWGAYSFEALDQGFQVHAFEPQPTMAAVLDNGLVGAIVHNVAVSDRPGRVEMRVPRNDIGYATIEPRNTLTATADLSRGVSRVDVETIKLDDAAIGCVSVLKIDVEGHELAVLRGAVAILQRDRPLLIVEVEDRHNLGSRRAVCSLLNRLGYDGFVFTQGRLVRLQDHDPGQSLSRNLVFAHRTRTATIEHLLIDADPGPADG